MFRGVVKTDSVHSRSAGKFKSNASDKFLELLVPVIPFQTNAPFSYPLKAVENLLKPMFSDVFRGYE